MKSGKCPKCGSGEVRRKATWGNRSYLMITFLNYAKLTDFICAQCGYTESYMLDEGNRAIVRDKWEKV